MPDGNRIAFQSNNGGPRNLFWQPSDGSGEPERLTNGEFPVPSPNSFSPDGQLLAFSDNNPTTGRDIWVLRMSDHKAQAFLKTPGEETAAKFSPDGKWLAYSSDESGSREVYVQPYPGPGGKWQISTEGGREVVWDANGEIFYRNGDKMMAVEIKTQPSLIAGKPQLLFEQPYLGNQIVPYYDVTPDGKRFVMIKAAEQQGQAASLTQINMVQNWFEELQK